ncbi:MAG: type II secretion system GspH family protein [Firmicutes bacterium]|nr:type II secretion system GspH family protein [[Eubacterium] siraeum]MCM1488438.1 type II secretion system GspH family protein [Bacillota bacterium]
MLNKIRKLKNKKGFTLVELIVVIAIIAVLTAVIVPLIGRYSTQAAYTTLQDAAQTISNDLNTVMSAVSMEGTPANCTHIQGIKTGGTLTVVVGGGASAIDDKIAAKAQESLENTLPDGATFSAETKGGAVVGVIYSNNSGINVSGAITGSGTASAVGASAVDGFTGAYATTSGAVGVAGACIPASAASAT